MLRAFSLPASIRPDTFSYLAMIVGFLAAAGLAGVVIASGKPVPIALTVGAVVGVVLMNFPSLVMWMIIAGTLLITGPLVFYVPAAGQVPWAFSLLGMAMLLIALMHAGLKRDRWARPVPAFVMIGLVFVFYGLASVTWFDGTASEGLAGAKRYYQFFGLMFALAMIRFPDVTVRRWLLFIVVLSFLSVAPALYQRYFVATRLIGGMDSIVGFFELSPTGMVASGVLAFLQIVVCGAAIAAWRDGKISLLQFALVVPFLLSPLLLGEVNVIFIWVPLCIVVSLLDLLKTRPTMFLTAGAGAVAVMVMFSSVYVLWQQETRTNRISVQQQIKTVIDYNFGELGYGHATDLNRKTVYGYWYRQHGLATKPLETMFGNGIGAGWPSPISTSPTVTKYRALQIGLTAGSLLLWDVGLVGFVLYVSMVGLAWIKIFKLSLVAPPGRERIICRSLLVAVSLLFTNIFYNNTAMGFPSMGALTALTLGCIAWMDRRQFRDQQPAAEQVSVFQAAR